MLDTQMKVRHNFFSRIETKTISISNDKLTTLLNTSNYCSLNFVWIVEKQHLDIFIFNYPYLLPSSIGPAIESKSLRSGSTIPAMKSRKSTRKLVKTKIVNKVRYIKKQVSL